MQTLDKLIDNDSKKIAIIDAETEITYEKLNLLSTQWAALLLEQQVKPDDAVVIKMSKSWQAIVAIFAVLKAKACYVILDPKLPLVAQEKIINQCSAKLILENMPELSITKPLPKISVTDSAYIYFTSGSTGEKKAASFDHQRVMNFLTWAKDTFNFNENDKVACVSPLSFDVCILDIFATFQAKATLVLVPDKIKLFTKNLKEYLQLHQVTVIQCVPTLWQEIVDIILPTLKKLIFTGQSITESLLQNIKITWTKNYPYCKFYNLYGQTEANSYLCYEFSLNEYPVAIAKLPLPNFVHIKDEQLWITGHTLMKNHTEYNTADLVKINNGKLYLIGRSDNLIKHKGYRISPEEIEAILNQFVSSSCIFFDNTLKAVVETQYSEIKIKEYCQKHLAIYQIPEKIIIVPAIIKNANGKIDRKKITETFSE